MKYGTDRLATRILHPFFPCNSELLLGTLKHSFIGLNERDISYDRRSYICRFFAFVALYITSLFTKIGLSV